MRIALRSLIAAGTLLVACQSQPRTDETAVAQSSAASSTTGVLRVGASDASASIYVDSVLVGKGRLSVTLPAGTHRLVVEAAGFTRVERTVTIRAGQTITENITLEKKTSHSVPQSHSLPMEVAA
jgi:hypothetical protein